MREMIERELSKFSTGVIFGRSTTTILKQMGIWVALCDSSAQIDLVETGSNMQHRGLMWAKPIEGKGRRSNEDGSGLEMRVKERMEDGREPVDIGQIDEVSCHRGRGQQKFQDGGESIAGSIMEHCPSLAVLTGKEIVRGGLVHGKSEDWEDVGL